MINTELTFIAIEEGFTGPMLVKGFETGGPNRVKVLLQWSATNRVLRRYHCSCWSNKSETTKKKLSAVNVLSILTKRDVFKEDHLNFDDLIAKV